MSINSQLIKQKEEMNNSREEHANESLLMDKEMNKISKQDNIQDCLLFVIEKFGFVTNRIYGSYPTEVLLELMMDPLSIMYRSSEDINTELNDKTQYILAFNENDEPIILYPSFISYRYYDSVTGKTAFYKKSIGRKLKNKCYVFTRPLKRYKSIVWTFVVSVLTYMTPNDALYLLLASGVMTLLGLGLPQINQWVYNVFLKDPAGQMSMFNLVLGTYLSLSIIRTVTSLLKSKKLNEVRNRISIRVEAVVMARILELPRSFFSDNSSGKISKRLQQCNNLTSTIINIFMDALLNFSFSGAYLMQMRGLSPALYRPAVVFLLINLALSIIVSLMSMFYERKTIELSMNSDSFFYSVIKGISKIKGVGVEKTVYAKWADMYQQILHYTYKKPFILRYQGVIISALSTVTTITLMGATFLNGLTQEEYMVFTSSFGMVSSVVGTVSSVMSQGFKLSTTAQSIKPIFDYEPPSNENKEFVRSIKGNIKVEDVYFSYEEEVRGCLRGVSLDVKAGEKVAIVGESGCGKSTLLKIIMGMEDAQAGGVYFDSKDINTLNTRSIRQKIGSVFQNSKLFPGTIYENVKFGCFEDVPEDQVWDALEKACIADYIRELPLQLNTEISQSNSSGFSGGQRQRLLIARALLRKPKILVLDEATSALDNITQKQVLDNILELSSTVLMVAHRLSTVMNFDRIVMLKDGVIVESGTYQELMEKNGLFAELVNKQLIEEKEAEQRKAVSNVA